MVSPKTFGFLGFFGIPAVLGPFSWNDIFVFGFFGFSAVSSVFFQNLTSTKVFCWNEVILLFLGLRGGGGGFSQDFWIFWFFGNPCSSGPFFGMKFLFLDFLDFLQFRANLSTIKTNRGFRV